MFEPQLVFVYGTLKSGYGNCRFTNLETQNFIGAARTKNSYLLTNTGFPYLCAKENDEHTYLPVIGELWEVSTPEVMAALDQLEGVSYGHYIHHHTDVVLEDGSEFSALSYMAGSTERAKSCPPCPVVEGAYEWGR